MYGLPTDTDVAALEGGELIFVGFGQFQLSLALSGDTDCSLQIQGDYRVAPSGGQPRTFSEPTAGASVLLPLLGHTVTAASVPTDGTLRLRFDDGSVVEVLDSSAEFESYQVQLADRVLVV